MSDLADRLDALAQDATRTVLFLPLELAVRARRHRRNRVRAGLVGIACAATVALLVALVPGHNNAVRVVTTPSSTPIPTTVPAPRSRPADVWDRIAAVAHNNAILFGDPSPTSATAVATTLQAYERATGGGRSPNDATTQVYFVVMTGRFTCGPVCYNISGHAPKGTVLSIALDKSTLASRSFSLTNQPVRLDQLGTVHQLDLSQTKGKVIIPPPVVPIQGTSIRVPNVVGEQWWPSQFKLSIDGFNPEYRVAHSAAANGIVLEQTPAAGTLTSLASNTVTLTLSIGPAYVPAAQPCLVSDLAAQRSTRVSAATGEHPYDWAFTNISKSTCVLNGYPTVTLYDNAGRTLGFTYSHSGDQMTTSAPPTPVYLMPGSQAWIRVNKYRCDIFAQDQSTTMLLNLPGTNNSTIRLPATYDYCQQAQGTQSLIVSVTPFEPIEPLLDAEIRPVTH